MALSDLNTNDKKVYEYLKLYDFVENPWSTKKAAKALKMKEDDIYESLSNLAEYMRNNIHIHYKDGSIRIGANYSYSVKSCQSPFPSRYPSLTPQSIHPCA